MSTRLRDVGPVRENRSSFYRATAICVLGAISVTGIGAAAHAAPSAQAGTQTISVAAGSPTLATQVSIAANTPAPTGALAAASSSTTPIEVQSRFSWLRDKIRQVLPAAWEALKDAANRTWTALVNAWNSLWAWVRGAIIIAVEESVAWILETIFNYFN